ncbi:MULTISPECIES: DUF2513 domain-containing protein [Pseudomonas]|uniref:DUF2513 domain-containing protein n=1 Tax=Pseudomonas TaxID=286 RepID=UPI00058D1D5B|nr:MULTISPECIES: DUF2513 domain-containing protein [Pseudomonas]MBA1245788.1 DUF2513 domain-containing protein [Pseudomonas japonica]
MELEKDLMREILLAVEASRNNPDHGIDLSIENRTHQDLSYHVMLMREAGLLMAQNATYLADTFPVWKPQRLTYKGHEFLDTIRDDEVWRQTKAGMEKAGGAGLSFVLEIAKAIGKQVLKERLSKLGIELP